MDKIEIIPLINYESQKAILISSTYDKAVTDESMKYFIDYLHTCISNCFPYTPANYFIDSRRNILNALVIVGLNIFLHDNPTHDKNIFEANIKTNDNGGSINQDVTEVSVRLEQNSLLVLYSCEFPLPANLFMKNNFLEFIEQYVTSKYGEVKKIMFFEESESDTLQIAVLIRG